MKTKSLTAWLCLTACSVFLPFTLVAQEPTPKGSAQDSAPGTSLENMLKRTVRKLDFKDGGNVLDAVDALRDETDANIVMDTDAKTCGFGELKLRNATLKTALDALVIAADGDVIVDYSGTRSPDLIAIHRWNKENEDLKTVSRTFRLPVWPDADYDKNLKGILSAMKRSIELRNEVQHGEPPLPMPKIEGHRATHLLLVAGPRASVEIIGRTLAASKGEKYEDDSEDKKEDSDISDAVQKNADDDAKQKADNGQ